MLPANAPATVLRDACWTVTVVPTAATVPTTSDGP
jgi:hypothetical protein